MTQVRIGSGNVNAMKAGHLSINYILGVHNGPASGHRLVWVDGFGLLWISLEIIFRSNDFAMNVKFSGIVWSDLFV